MTRRSLSMFAQIVRFRSGLSDDEVLELYRSRAPRYRELDGLVQKYYLRYSTGEHGAVYLWRSEADLRRFRESELGKTIAQTYQIREPEEPVTGEVVMSLREGE